MRRGRPGLLQFHIPRMEQRRLDAMSILEITPRDCIDDVGLESFGLSAFFCEARSRWIGEILEGCETLVLFRSIALVLRSYCVVQS